MGDLLAQREAASHLGRILAKMPGVSEALGVEELIRMMQTQADAMTCYASTLNYPPNTAAKWLNAGVERLRQQAERIAELTLKLSNAELLCGHHKTVIVERGGRIAALEAALRDLLDRVDRNGGIGPYNGGVPFAVKTARALLGDSK